MIAGAYGYVYTLHLSNTSPMRDNLKNVAFIGTQNDPNIIIN